MYRYRATPYLKEFSVSSSTFDHRRVGIPHAFVISIKYDTKQVFAGPTDCEGRLDPLLNPAPFDASLLPLYQANEVEVYSDGPTSVICILIFLILFLLFILFFDELKPSKLMECKLQQWIVIRLLHCCQLLVMLV